MEQVEFLKTVSPRQLAQEMLLVIVLVAESG